MARAHRDEERPASAGGGQLHVDPTVQRYVLPDERVVIQARQHWARILEPVASTTLGFLAAAWASGATMNSINSGVLVFWILWAALALRCVWILLQWRFRWFIATDRRILLLHGVVPRRVAMMPLVKVTDMSYDRSVLGELLHYGAFVMESAGQDQALRKVDYVRNPLETYHTLSDTLFGRGSSGRPRNVDPNDDVSNGSWASGHDGGPRATGGQGRRDPRSNQLAEWTDSAWPDDGRPGDDGPSGGGTRPVPIVPGPTATPGAPNPPAVPPRHRRITPSSARTQVVDPPEVPRPPKKWWPRRHERFDVYSEPPGPGWDVSDEERGSFIPVDPDQR